MLREAALACSPLISNFEIQFPPRAIGEMTGMEGFSHVLVHRFSKTRGALERIGGGNQFFVNTQKRTFHRMVVWSDRGSEAEMPARDPPPHGEVFLNSALCYLPRYLGNKLLLEESNWHLPSVGSVLACDGPAIGRQDLISVGFKCLRPSIHRTGAPSIFPHHHRRHPLSLAPQNIPFYCHRVTARSRISEFDPCPLTKLLWIV